MTQGFFRSPHILLTEDVPNSGTLQSLYDIHGKAGCQMNLHEQDLLLYRCSACCSLSRGRKRCGWMLHGTLSQQTNQQQSGATTRQQSEVSKTEDTRCMNATKSTLFALIQLNDYSGLSVTCGPRERRLVGELVLGHHA